MEEIQTQNLNIYKSPRALFEGRKVAGSATHKQKLKQYKLCCPSRSVCLFSLFSHGNKKKKEFIYRVCWWRFFFSPLVKTSSPKPQNAPLTSELQPVFQGQSLTELIKSVSVHINTDHTDCAASTWNWALRSQMRLHEKHETPRTAAALCSF